MIHESADHEWILSLQYDCSLRRVIRPQLIELAIRGFHSSVLRHCSCQRLSGLDECLLIRAIRCDAAPICAIKI